MGALPHRRQTLTAFLLLGEVSFSEANHNIARNVGEWFIDSVDRVACLLGLDTWSGLLCSAVSGNGSGRASSGPGCQDEQLEGTLAKFCGTEFGDRVFYCECCADHLIGDVPRRASLLMPGEVTTAAAWVRDEKGAECRMGQLRTWSLGAGRVPTALCDRGRFKCKCAHLAWREAVSVCGDGEACVPPEVVKESHATEDGLLREGARVRATVDIHYGPDPDAAAAPRNKEMSLYTQVAHGAVETVLAGATGDVMQTEPHFSVRWLDYPQLGSAVVYRGQVTAESVSAGLDGGAKTGSDLAGPRCLASERISIGQSRCEDVDFHICPKVYSSAGNWHFCSVHDDVVKTCLPNIVHPDYPKKQSEQWKQWAMQWAWRPEFSWKPTTNKDHTVYPTEATASQIQEQLLKDSDVHGDEDSTPDAIADDRSGAPRNARNWLWTFLTLARLCMLRFREARSGH